MNDEEISREMAALARTFPSMKYALGVEPWNALQLETWAKGPHSHGQVVTARFLLAVWDPHRAWELERFELMEALRVWDDAHRGAFLAWASEPWWP
ncbi:hypothetical protein OJF2_79340 (plasmid) [Aquisphaera giovannonii]|uniref:Uncharacterized protein n=1 Tax=Aquisphaera giovannonii TaxID=406548 RepID=A0A5B9WGD2_9BACT|nr:hypothetical protein [Aquisphaera giovannonii]QEH39319.1 hypothetical protein OJF2_79340 [Aquisphaera giovannonii]